MKTGQGADDKSRTVILTDDEITLGRDQTCQVVLAKMGVSRKHARIVRDETLFFIEDLESTYGTQLNGQKLPKNEKRLLKNGDVIAIANFDLTFDRVADANNEASGNTMFVSRNLVKGAMLGLGAAGKGALFRVMNGPLDGKKIEIADAQEYVFGRDVGEADIVLNDDLVSRRHARARRDLLGTHLEDLGSRNGIKVNRKKVKRVTLKDGDEVEIGGVRLLFIDHSEVREDPVVLSSANSEEHTMAVGDLPPDPEPDPEPQPEPEPEPPAPEPEPEPEAEPEPEPDPEPQLDEEPIENVEDQPDPDAPPDDHQYEEEPADDSPRKLIDFSNKQTIVALAVGGVTVLVGLVVLIALLAGA
jgi:pSer/pThr/pTyr-binding forkhead associated (FHA) protein